MSVFSDFLYPVSMWIINFASDIYNFFLTHTDIVLGIGIGAITISTIFKLVT